MTAVLKHLRSMSGLGILADRDGKAPFVLLRRYNLIYGFNGSGKSTLSRMLASLQAGVRDPRLPSDSAFDLELEDGSILKCPDSLTGLEARVLVFNTDFIEQNLQWSSGHANPVFYIGKAQAKLAEELVQLRSKVPAMLRRLLEVAGRLKTAEKELQTFRRERARSVADRLRLRNRKYEAPQLTNDFNAFEPEQDKLLEEDALDAATAICRQDDPPAKSPETELDLKDAAKALWAARMICGIAPSTSVLAEFERHPEMMLWLKEGHEYHAAHGLKECLFCAGPLSAERLAILFEAFDQGFNNVLAGLDANSDRVDALAKVLSSSEAADTLPVGSSRSADYRAAAETYKTALGKVCRWAEIATDLLADKRRSPAKMFDSKDLPLEHMADKAVSELADARDALNHVIRDHNDDVDHFTRRQDDARLSIRKHYISEARAEYLALTSAVKASEQNQLDAIGENDQLNQDIRTLEGKIREHGPAADAINKLLHSYLGHPELTVVAVSDGYEFHRNGQKITGLPSEGEKTAIALCYFMSMLESEGRKTRDLIVVVDDPISSLDTRSLNFACNLIKSRLKEAAQLIVLTHNQNCVNEFRKPWRDKAKPKDGSNPTAALLFLDVTMPKGANKRSSKLVEMPALLREYESEYHYLFNHVLKFAENVGEYEYAYVMPNVMRRVLDVFLAFRCPGSAGLAPKVEQLCAAYPDLDHDRIIALERLTQVESHSDNLDDLIAFSSMTLEESKDAAKALLAVIERVDPEHLKGLRKLCH